MAHLLSWIIGEELTLNDILEKPFIIQLLKKVYALPLNMHAGN